MKKNRLIISYALVFLAVLFLGLFLGYYLNTQKSRVYQKYAEQICIALEKKDITIFDEICDEETVFCEQDNIYKNVREELKENLNKTDFRVKNYEVSDYNGIELEPFSIIYVGGKDNREYSLSGYITIKKKNNKYYINHLSLSDNSNAQIHFEIIGKKESSF